VRARARQVEAARNQLAPSLSRSPRADEVAAALGMTVADVLAVDADVQHASVLSLDGFTGELVDTLLADGHARDPLQAVLDHEHTDHVLAAIAELPERHRLVFVSVIVQRQRYAEVAAELGVTESRVSQLRKDAVRRVGRSLAEHEQHAA